MAKKTLYDKLWEQHLVVENDDGTSLIYIDRHLIHEVTSPQAFAGLEAHGRPLWRPGANLAMPDHNVPTTKAERDLGVAGIIDSTAKIQVATLDEHCEKFSVKEFKINDERQGVVHVVGPETGATLPGMTVVCGDSHTSTHGALGALAHGIGTSEVEHVLATQCLVQRKMKNMRVVVSGELSPYVSGKDVALAIIAEIGTAGGNGYAIEFSGAVIESLSVEGRMSLCNMAIEAGARAGLVAVDQRTIDYVAGRDFSPKGEHWESALAYWHTLHSDDGAVFDSEIFIDGSKIRPQVSWGTSPEMTLAIDKNVPVIDALTDPVEAKSIERALEYMGLEQGQPLQEVKIDKVFIGSCTNSRIEDLRAAAHVAKGRSLASNVSLALVVPGSQAVKRQAESEGLDQVFRDAGFEWREPGCSMCLAMNADKLSAGERCASTSNRNFEGRQGWGGRTHLLSPAMAAAAAVRGHLSDVTTMIEEAG